MVVLILGALWVVVLVPPFIKRRLERRPSESIDSFHQQLHLLERTGPKLVEPAYRLETARSRTGVAVGQSGFPAVSSMPGRPNLVLLRPVGEGGGNEDDVVDQTSGEHYRRVLPLTEPQRQAGPPAAPLRAVRNPADAERRRYARRRRRDILLGLVVTFLFTALVGVVPSLHGLWVVTGLSGAALAVFVGLGVYAQLLEADRGAPARPARIGGYSHAYAAGQTADGPGAWDRYATEYGEEQYYGDAYGAEEAYQEGYAYDEAYGSHAEAYEPHRVAAGR